MEYLSRCESLIGKENLDKLKNAKVLIFGLGGVGSACFEALVRGGIGSFLLVDKDKIDITNINRQLIATHENVGLSKVLEAKKRGLSINPSAKIETKEMFYLNNDNNEFDFSDYDYVIDAVDNVSAKLSIIEEAKKVNTKVITSMGTANKFDPTLFKVADISKTSVCPLAKVIRSELKKRNIKNVKCVYSDEVPHKMPNGTLGSMSFVPPISGYIMAGQVIKDIISQN